MDDNQEEIVKALRLMGCSVSVSSSAGKGFPDLVVGFRGYNYLLEIKDGEKSESRQKLTQAEEEFHTQWRGQIAIVHSSEEAMRVIMLENLKQQERIHIVKNIALLGKSIKNLQKDGCI